MSKFDFLKDRYAKVGFWGTIVAAICYFTPLLVWTFGVGQTVQWKNTSLLAHSVTGYPSQSTIEGSAQLPNGAEAFDSGMLEQTFKHTFNTSGIYQYFCIPHEGAKMYGWVIVSQSNKKDIVVALDARNHHVAK